MTRAKQLQKKIISMINKVLAPPQKLITKIVGEPPKKFSRSKKGEYILGKSTKFETKIIEKFS